MIREYFIIALLFLPVLTVANPSGCCARNDGSLEDFIVENNANLQKILKKKNKHFVIQYAHNLGGKVVRVGENSVLDFKGGCLQSGEIYGESTEISYNAPFWGKNLIVSGCVISKKSIIRDIDVFVSVNHNQREIQGLFDLSNGVPILFSNGIYRDVSAIQVRNNIEADFGNSTIYAKVTNKKSSTIFKRGKENLGDAVDYVYIKNLTINGGIDKKELKQKLPENRPSPCIELFRVTDVILDNVDIVQFNPGTENHRYMTHSYRDVYENYLVALMCGVTAKITNCDISYCTDEGFKFAPAIDPHNFIEFASNSSKNRYWTFLEVDDGRCLVKDNMVEGAASSAFNLFCYDSEVYNNTFKNSVRGCAIDLSEPADGGGAYRSYNVLIHDNKCYNYPQLLEMWAGNVKVYDNYIDGIIISKKNSAGCIVRLLNKYTSPSEWSFKAPYNNPAGQNLYNKDIQIYENVFDGEFKVGITSGNRYSTEIQCENLTIKANRFLDSKKGNPDYYPVLLFNVENIIFEDNYIEVLKKGTYNSPKDNAYFYCDRCCGTMTSTKNRVIREIDEGQRYVFTIAGSFFDEAIVIDNSNVDFCLDYRPNMQNGIRCFSITTNCKPFPGRIFGPEVVVKTR